MNATSGQVFYHYDNFLDDLFTFSEDVEEIEFVLYEIIEIFFQRLTLIANYIFGCKFECIEEYLNKNFNDSISFIDQNFELEDFRKVGLIENLKSCYNGTVYTVLEFLNCSIPVNPSFSGIYGNNSCSNLKNFSENNKERSAVIYEGFKNYFNETFNTFVRTYKVACQNQLYSIPKTPQDLEHVDEVLNVGTYSIYLPLFAAIFLILLLLIFSKCYKRKYKRNRRNLNTFFLS